MISRSTTSKLSKLMLSITLFATCLVARAQQPTINVARMDDLPLQIGAGYSPETVSVLNSPFANTANLRSNGQGAIVEATVDVISSWSQLYEKLSFDASISARSSFYSGKLTTQIAEENQITASSFVWMVRLHCDYGWWSLDDRSFSATANQLKSKPAEFVRRYGSYMVTAEHRAAMLTATFSVDNLSTSQRRDIAASLSISGGSILSGGSVNASFNTTMTNLQKKYRVKCTLRAYGGPGLDQNIANVAVSGDWETTKQAIDKYVASMTVDQARTIGYYLQHISTFGITASLFDSSKEARLGTAFENYKSAKATVNKINEVLDNQKAKYSWVLPGDITEYSRVLPLYTKYLTTIVKIGKQLALGQDVTVPSLPSMNVGLPYAEMTLEKYFMQTTGKITFTGYLSRVNSDNVQIWLCFDNGNYLEPNTQITSGNLYDPSTGSVKFSTFLWNVGDSVNSGWVIVAFDNFGNELGRCKIAEFAR